MPLAAYLPTCLPKIDQDLDYELDVDPKKWERPKWFNDISGDATICEIVWALSTNHFEINPPGDNAQVCLICPVCKKTVTAGNASVDHQINWRVYAQMQGVKKFSELYEWYHDLVNLHVVHSGCKSPRPRRLMRPTYH